MHACMFARHDTEGGNRGEGVKRINGRTRVAANNRIELGHL